MLHKRRVERGVVRRINGARRAIERHRSALVVEQCGLADGLLAVVERHDVARSRHPQRHVLVGERGEVAYAEHFLVRDEYLGAVSGVVHDECALLLLFLYHVRHLGIGVARGARLHLIGIPHHLLHHVLRMSRRNLVGNEVGVGHVYIIVAVVAHEHYSVLPCTAVAVLGIIDGFVYHYLRFGIAHYGESSHADVELVYVHRSETLAVVEHGVETVVDVADAAVVRVLTLERQEVVVGVLARVVRRNHTVVPKTIAEEQEVFRAVVLASGAVVEHLHVAAISRSVGGAARELVEEFVGWHEIHLQRVVLIVERLQTLRLLQQFLRSGYYYHQIGLRVGMVVLVHYVVNVGRSRETCGFKVGQRARLVPCHRHHVAAHRVGAAEHREFHLRRAFNSRHTVGSAALASVYELAVGVGSLQRAHDGVVILHLHLAVVARRNHNV